jgi:hypothetical protein
MKNNIQGQGKICVLATIFFQEEELFRPVTHEALTTEFYGNGTDIVADVSWISRQRQLIAVAASKLDHGTDSVISNKLIQDGGLELSKVAV